MITMLADYDENELAKMREFVEGNWDSHGDCWIWRGSKSRSKYGIAYGEPAHRLAYALLVGDFPASAFICHHCDTPACINPKHLYVGNAKSNAADAAERNRNPAVRSIYTKAIRGMK